MYGRDYGERELTFEASGGLIHGTLVLQDRETDSYWPIMAGRSIEGRLEGTRMEELAIAEKRRWGDWRRAHPDTEVLSVDGREDAPPGYESYFASDEGFRGIAAADDRLATKTPIYAFRLGGLAVAVPHADIEGGAEFDVAGRRVRLHRPPGAPLFESTTARMLASGDCDAATDAGCGAALTGFDTFWYSWSLNNPDTLVLRR